jgi:hypothetical protein
MKMSKLESWRQHVELNKFTGPTVKLLQLDAGLWAVLDHEYNFVAVADVLELVRQVVHVQHPPQRERPKPVIPDDYYENRPSQLSMFNIKADDLDL